MMRKCGVFFVVLYTFLFVYGNLIRPVLLNSDFPLILLLGFDLLLVFCICFFYVTKIKSSAFEIEKAKIGQLIKCVAAFLLLNVLFSSFLLNVFSFDKLIHGDALLFSKFKCPIVDSSYWIPYLISLLLMAPIAEEILYRGLLQKWLVGKTGNMWIGILGSAIVFSLAHFNSTKLLLIFICGCFYGFIYLKYKRLLFCIICHFFWNLLALFLVDELVPITCPRVVYIVLFSTILTLLIWSIFKDKTAEH